MSCNLQKFAGEIGQYFGTAGGEVDIVFDADAAPAWPVDTRLDRDDRTLSERRLDRLGEPRGFVDLESESMAEAVAECVAVAAVLYVASGETVGLLPFHSG